METTLNAVDRTVLDIPGMHCGGCARTIEKALHQVAGVEVAKADAGKKIAEVAGSASGADLVAAVLAGRLRSVDRDERPDCRRAAPDAIEMLLRLMPLKPKPRTEGLLR